MEKLKPKPAADALQFSTVLFESDALQIIERIREDPAAPPKLKTIRTLSLIDRATGEEIYSEEHLPGQLLAGCRGASCRTLKNALAGNAVLPQSDGIRVTRKVSDDVYMLESADLDARPEVMMADPALASFLKAEGNYLEPNGVLRLLSTIPNDPQFGNLWGLHNTGQDLPVSRDFDVPKADGTTDINAPEAWDIWNGDRNILVCVIDTGTNYNIPDLAPNIWTNPGEFPGNGIDDDGNGFVDDVHGYDFINNDGDPMDDHGHGTHVAGTVGAVGDNGIGIAGVMWKAKIMALKFLSAGGSGTLEDAVRAIDYATKMGCSLTSNSWGGSGVFQALYDAIARARDADSLFVAAAGNSSADSDTRPMYPAAYDLPNIISVAAIDAQGRLASFSNWGATSVDLGAPGVQVLSFDKDGGYKWWAGTSMATPHVSGVVGLMRSLDPSASYENVKKLLLLTVATTDSLVGRTVTDGRVNAKQAVENMASGFFPFFTHPKVPDDGFLSSGETVDLVLTLTNVGTKAGTGVQVHVSTSEPKVTIVTPLPLPYGDMPLNASVTQTVQVAIAPDLATPTDVTFTLTIRDGRDFTYIRTFEKPVYTMGTIGGTVTNDRYGTPIEGATVSYEGMISGTDLPRALYGEIASDAIGAYAFSLPLGTYTLLAEKDEFIRLDPVTVTLPPDQTLDWRLGAPEFDAQPRSFSFTVPQGSRSTQVLGISNAEGSTDLTFEIPALTGSAMRLRSLRHDFWSERFTRGVAWDGRNLWLPLNFPPVPGNLWPEPAHLMKVDAVTGNALKEIITRNPACTEETNRRGLDAMTWGGGIVWAMEYLPADTDGCLVDQFSPLVVISVVGIDPETGKLIKRIDLRAYEIAWYENTLLIVGVVDGKAHLVQIDPEDGTSRVGPPLPDAFQGVRGMAWDGEALWGARNAVEYDSSGDVSSASAELLRFAVGDDLSLTHLYTLDLRSLYTGRDENGKLRFRFIDDLAADGDVLWVRTAVPTDIRHALGFPTTDLLLPGLFQPWLSVDPRSGSVPYAQNNDVGVTTDASNLAVGTYNGKLAVLTNDPDELLTVIPVSLTVLPPDAKIVCLSALLQSRTRRGVTHELSSARLTVTDAVTGTVTKDVSLPLDTGGKLLLTDASGIDGSKSYDLTLKPRGHLPLTINGVDDVFSSCHPMGEARHGDYSETGRIDLSDLVTAINYHIQRKNSPYRMLFEDIYHSSFGLADIVEVIRNYVETR